MEFKSSFTPLKMTASEALVIQLLRNGKIFSRTDISRTTRWSIPKASSIVNRLIDRKILSEVGLGNPTGGRRARRLSFNIDLGYIVGVDLGATSIDLAISDLNGHILARSSCSADVNDGPAAILGEVCRRLLDLLQSLELQPDQVLGIGIGVPGPIDFDEAILVAPPLMPSWENYPIRDFVSKTFSHAAIVVDNDVNIMALGELRAGAGKGVENFIFVKIGTGIGAGIVCDGAIYRGDIGSAGDIGHICADYNGPACRCGNNGCLEAMAGGPAIAKRGEEAAQSGASTGLANRYNVNGGFLRAEDVGAVAREGDHAAIEIIIQTGQLIGNVLASVVNFFNPSLILLGGGVAKIESQLLPAIRRAVLRRSTSLATKELTIVYSSLGSEVGVIGAINLALDQVFVAQIENDTVMEN